jgi:hypothetical protein
MCGSIGVRRSGSVFGWRIVGTRERDEGTLSPEETVSVGG